MFFLGTDEAGYGPNLGPLVVSATAWEVPDGLVADKLRLMLADFVAAAPQRASPQGPTRVAIGDSKVLYQSGKGLQHLEYGLWAALATLERRPARWREVWDALAPAAAAEWDCTPWFAGYDGPAPVDAIAAHLRQQISLFAQGLCATGVRLAAMESRAIFPEGFNRLLGRHESKGALLSHVTLELAAAIIARLPEAPVAVVCDKHGGRNRYQSLLAEHFPEWLIEIHGESRDRSVYRFGPAGRRIEFRFQIGAEEFLPAGLASMASKYLRELAMRAWNEFWCRHVPGLAPTAGYPEDARRFKAAIAAVQQDLGIDDRVIWREK